MNSPLVSCIIPCYNRAAYVIEAIESVFAQTYPHIEIIVVDDGSTDNTAHALKQYDTRIKVIKQNNSGSSAARNAGISISSGEYLAWLDSDDLWHKQKIAAQVSAMHSFPLAGVVYTRCSPMDKNGWPPTPELPLVIPEPVTRSDIQYIHIVENEVMPSSCLVRRTAIEDVGTYNSEFFFAEDWEFSFRLARKYPFVYIDAPLTRYRIHDEAKSKNRLPHALGQLKLRAAIEAARTELLASDPGPEMRNSYAMHRKKHAEAFYRVAKLSYVRGDYSLARSMISDALRLNQKNGKYCILSLKIALIGLNRNRRLSSQKKSPQEQDHVAQ